MNYVAELDVTRSSLYMRKKIPISVSPDSDQIVSCSPMLAQSHLGTVAHSLLTFITQVDNGFSGIDKAQENSSLQFAFSSVYLSRLDDYGIWLAQLHTAYLGSHPKAYQPIFIGQIQEIKQKSGKDRRSRWDVNQMTRTENRNQINICDTKDNMALWTFVLNGIILTGSSA